MHSYLRDAMNVAAISCWEHRRLASFSLRLFPPLWNCHNVTRLFISRLLRLYKSYCRPCEYAKLFQTVYIVAQARSVAMQFT